MGLPCKFPSADSWRVTTLPCYTADTDATPQRGSGESLRLDTGNRVDLEKHFACSPSSVTDTQRRVTAQACSLFYTEKAHRLVVGFG